MTLTSAVNNNNWTREKIEPFLGKNIIEIGSGIGTFSKFIIGSGRTVTLSDLNDNYINDLKEKYKDNPSVSVLKADAGKIDETIAGKKFDTVVAINIIEHLENDDEAFERIKRTLLPGGRLIFIVPAHKQLFSRFDKSIGHFRRYRKSELERQLVGKGYRIEYIEFMNAVSACVGGPLREVHHHVGRAAHGAEVGGQFEAQDAGRCAHRRCCGRGFRKGVGDEEAAALPSNHPALGLQFPKGRQHRVHRDIQAPSISRGPRW